MYDRPIGRVLVTVALLLLTLALGAGQARTAAKGSSSVPRTSWEYQIFTVSGGVARLPRWNGPRG